MIRSLRAHWAEYLIEAALLGILMGAPCIFRCGYRAAEGA